MRNLSLWFKAGDFNLYYLSQMVTQPHPALLISACSDPCLFVLPGFPGFGGSSERQCSRETNSRGPWSQPAPACDPEQGCTTSLRLRLLICGMRVIKVPIL